MKVTKRFVFIPIFLAAFLFLFYSAYTNIKDRTLKEFNNHQVALSKEASSGIEFFFEYYRRELLFLSKLGYVSILNEQGKNILEDFYKSHSDQIEAITIVDNKGIILYSYPFEKSIIGQDISSQQHVQDVIKTHDPIVSDIFKSVQGFRAIAYHVPIFDGKEYKGSIAILIPIDKLGKQFIDNIRTGETGYVCLISEDGNILFSPISGQTGKSLGEIYGNSSSIIKLVDRSLREDKGTTIIYNSSISINKKDSVKTIASFYRISLGNTFWTLLTFTPEKEVFSTFNSFRDRLFILFGLIVLVMAVYFYLAFKAGTILKEEKSRKALEDILRESEKRFRVMFELSPAGILLIDEKGTIIEVNSAFCMTLGYSKQELLSNNIRLFSSPVIEGEIESNIEQILAGKTLKHEVTNFRKDGTTCEIALVETMILLPDGKPGILSVSNDITETKRFRQELISSKEKAEESDRLKSTFLTNMSHELRTPLNAIIGFSSFMADTGNDEETIKYARIIFESGQHLLKLVEDILDTSMIEIGQIKISNEKTDVISVLNEVKNIIIGERLRENKTHIKIILKSYYESGQKLIMTDSRKLKQVLINLLKNALKYTEEGYIEFGFTEIEKSGSKFLKFFVKDTGIGIDKKHHEVIFNIFRQIDDAYTRKYGGAGIGLSIAKSMVEMLGGEIWVDSEPGKGSMFTFTIPTGAGIGQNDNLSDQVVKISDKYFEGKTVLIAEDEVSNFEFLRIHFTRKKIRVLWAKNGSEALKHCENDPAINLVLMDIKMPIMNGLEATKKIKEKYPTLPVIAQTAYAMASEKEAALNSGCDDYLSKPIKIDQLNILAEKYLLQYPSLII